MGYNSWYDLMCSPYMNETTLERTADAMIASKSTLSSVAADAIDAIG